MNPPEREEQPPLTGESLAFAQSEYQSLRQEILQTQQTRVLILVAVLAALGTIAGFVVGHEDSSHCDLFSPALVAFGYVVLAAAAHLTTVLTQRIDLLAGFIRYEIEPRLPGGDVYKHWETAWNDHRKAFHAAGRGPELPLGTSKALAFYYTALIVGLIGIHFVAGGSHCWLLRAAVVVPPAIAATVLVADLWTRRVFKKRWGDKLKTSPSSGLANADRDV